MSDRNGNRSRFQRERQKKLIRRKRTQELRRELAGTSVQAPISDSGKIEIRTDQTA